MQRFGFAVLLAAVLFAPVTRGEDKPSSEAAVELARLVLPQSQYDAMIQNVCDVTAQSISAQAKEGGQELPSDFATRFKGEMQRMLPYQEMIDMQAGLLVKYYTVQELRDLTTFYKTPVGMKAIRVMPAVMADVTGLMQEKMAREMPAAIERIFDTGKAAKSEKAGKARQ